MTHHRLLLAGLSLIALASAACSEPAETPAPAPAAEVIAPAPAAPDYAALLTAGTRPVADAADDAARKPVEVLAFSKIMPGQTVLEMEAGAGYYTELLSGAVGPSGKVIMQAPAEFEGFYKDGLAARLLDNRLANVTFSASHFDKLDAADGTVDVVTWFLGPHEIYFKPENAPNGLGDPAGTYADIFRVLKPGGYFVVLEHAAAAGSGTEVGGTLHRIDPAHVKAAAQTAGFVLDEESPLLANPEDDHTKGVFDESIRRRTDQFLLRYKKPV
ncbi:MAG: class I SAM-dependent methyltransferase [Alphaproteobacteria bacterium]|nr:class I SAM-dependent methyltransferase [Alphaproteobacteria bacterium]